MGSVLPRLHSGQGQPRRKPNLKALAADGVGCSLDDLGLGDSEGDWGEGSFSNKVADTVRAVRFMNEPGRPVRLLVGRSFGGRRRSPPPPAQVGPRSDRICSPTSPGTSGTTMTLSSSGSSPTAKSPFLIGGKALALEGTSSRACAWSTSASRYAP